jgi:hypothetical protein
VGVLLGAGGEGGEGAEGLLERVEKDVLGLLEGLENAFAEGAEPIGAFSLSRSRLFTVELRSLSRISSRWHRETHRTHPTPRL